MTEKSRERKKGKSLKREIEKMGEKRHVPDLMESQYGQ